MKLLLRRIAGRAVVLLFVTLQVACAASAPPPFILREYTGGSGSGALIYSVAQSADSWDVSAGVTIPKTTCTHGSKPQILSAWVMLTPNIPGQPVDKTQYYQTIVTQTNCGNWEIDIQIGHSKFLAFDKQPSLQPGQNVTLEIAYSQGTYTYSYQAQGLSQSFSNPGAQPKVAEFALEVPTIDFKAGKKVFAAAPSFPSITMLNMSIGGTALNQLGLPITHYASLVLRDATRLTAQNNSFSAQAA